MPFFVGPFPFIFSFSLMSEVYGLLLSESRKSVIEKAGEEFSLTHLKKGIKSDDVDGTFDKWSSGRPMRGIPSPLYFNSFSTRISTVFPSMIFR